MGGYWFFPAAIASVTASTSLRSQSKSGKPWPRLIAECFSASADITVKMVVPTEGSLLSMFMWMTASGRRVAPGEGRL